MPQPYIVGGVGEQVSSINHADGTKTVSFHAEAVHDFAWTADRRYRVIDGTFNGSAGPVRIQLLMQPGHLSQAQRYLDSLQRTMQRFDEWYGPYPYPQITVVDPPDEGTRAGGMEYPTLITASTFWFMPCGVRLLEMVVEHEFGHQYWYGMVATNEFEEAWLDEGINSYSEVKVMNSLFGPAASMLEVGGITLGEAGLQRSLYARLPDTDPLVRPGWQFLNRSAYGNVTYGKTATVLLTLESIIGEAILQRALRAYFLRYRFTHPTGEDFLKTVEEVSGKDLRWYFNQAVYGTNLLDYEVASLQSDRPDWYRKAASAHQDDNHETVYHSTIVVHRKGDFIFPVELEVRFDNGEVAREQWDGRDRWTRFTYDKKAKVVSAEIDPAHRVLLDDNVLNNSRTAAADRTATRKLANYWMFLTQMFAQVLSWLV